VAGLHRETRDQLSSAQPQLLDPTTIRRLTADLGLRPTKQRGQNFVTDPNTVRRIVTASAVGRDDTVLELGAGLGSLTLGLLEVGARVLAVEIDRVLAEALPETISERAPGQARRLTVMLADGLSINQLPERPTALVANLPYNIAVPVLLHLLETFETWSRGLVMVQGEVARRLVARPGSKIYGVPSVKMAWYAETAKVGAVPPTVFWPVPKVESGLVSIRRREPPQTNATKDEVFAVIDAAFGQRRKMLRTALGGLAGSASVADERLLAAGVDPRTRGEMLDVADFARIAEHIHHSPSQPAPPPENEPGEPRR